MTRDDLEHATWMALALTASGPIDTRSVDSLAHLLVCAEPWTASLPSPEQVISGMRELTVRGIAAVAGTGIDLERGARREIAHVVETAPSRTAAREHLARFIAGRPRRVAVQPPHPAPERIRAAIERQRRAAAAVPRT